MKENLTAELYSLATFLDIPVTPNDVKCAVDHSPSQYQRQASLKSRLHQMNEVFTSEEFLRIDELQKDTEQLVKLRFKIPFNLTSDVLKLKKNKKRV